MSKKSMVEEYLISKMHGFICVNRKMKRPSKRLRGFIKKISKN